MKIINVNADIHPDGDVYVYDKKTKEFKRIGVLIDDNIDDFIFDDNNKLVSAPVPNPSYNKLTI